MYQGKGTYLESYLDSISTLPSELGRNFALIRELDFRTYDTVEKIEKLKNNLLTTTAGTRKAVHDCTDEKATKNIKTEIQAAIEYSDEKVELSNQTYELIDRHIRKLDADLKKFETELENAEEEKKKKKSKQSHELNVSNNNGGNIATTTSSNATTTSSKKGKARDSLNTSNANGGQLNASGSSISMRKQKSTQDITSIANGSDVRVFNAVPNDLELAIDPNEPTYCFCNRVSFGEMVGCENPDCKIEWFHFECVGLTSTPKGKWYCPDCTRIKNKK